MRGVMWHGQGAARVSCALFCGRLGSGPRVLQENLLTFSILCGALYAYAELNAPGLCHACWLGALYLQPPGVAGMPAG